MQLDNMKNTKTNKLNAKVSIIDGFKIACKFIHVNSDLIMDIYR